MIKHATTIWRGSVLTGEQPPLHSGELNLALSQVGGPTQSQQSRPMSSGHHISMEHRLRRNHLQLTVARPHPVSQLQTMDVPNAAGHDAGGVQTISSASDEPLMPQIMECPVLVLQEMMRDVMGGVKACREKSVMTMDTPDQKAHDVAELVFAVVLNSDRKSFGGRTSAQTLRCAISVCFQCETSSYRTRMVACPAARRSKQSTRS